MSNKAVTRSGRPVVALIGRSCDQGYAVSAGKANVWTRAGSAALLLVCVLNASRSASGSLDSGALRIGLGEIPLPKLNALVLHGPAAGRIVEARDRGAFPRVRPLGLAAACDLTAALGLAGAAGWPG